MTTLLRPLWNSCPCVVLGILLRSMMAAVGSGRTTEDLPRARAVVTERRFVAMDNMTWPSSPTHYTLVTEWLRAFTGLRPFLSLAHPCPDSHRKWTASQWRPGLRAVISAFGCSLRDNTERGDAMCGRIAAIHMSVHGSYVYHPFLLLAFWRSRLSDKTPWPKSASELYRVTGACHRS
jgi:hypothetical protein